MVLFGKKLDPNKLILGCKQIENQPGILACEIKYKDGKEIKTLTKELIIERVGEDKFRILNPGDLTVEELNAINEALKKLLLKV